MGLPKVNKFLCCLELETGGIIIGVLAAIFSGIFFIILGLAMAALMFALTQPEIHKEEGGRILVIGDELKSFENVETSTLLHFLLGLAIFNAILLLYLLFVFIAGIQLVRGTKTVRESYKPAIPIQKCLVFLQRNHNQMKLYMILMIIGVVLAFVDVLNSGFQALPKAIVSAVIGVYLFICIYSLYDMIKNERLGTNNQMHMGSPQTMVYAQPQQVQGYPVQQQPYQYQPQGVVYAQPPVYDQAKSNPA
jgi:hypothetical protein